MILKSFAVGFAYLVLSFVLVTPMPAMAQTGAATVAPLGFVVGKATLKEVKAKVPASAKLSLVSTHSNTGGPVFKAQGGAFDIEDLKEVWFVFDEREALVLTALTMDKNGFDRIYQTLAGKYRLVRKDIPFVGDKYARFEQGDVVIEIDAPHMDFTMTLSYITAALKRQVEQGTREKAAQKKKREAGQF